MEGPAPQPQPQPRGRRGCPCVLAKAERARLQSCSRCVPAGALPVEHTHHLEMQLGRQWGCITSGGAGRAANDEKKARKKEGKKERAEESSHQVANAAALLQGGQHPRLGQGLVAVSGLQQIPVVLGVIKVGQAAARKPEGHSFKKQKPTNIQGQSVSPCLRLHAKLAVITTAFQARVRPASSTRSSALQLPPHIFPRKQLAGHPSSCSMAETGTPVRLVLPQRATCWL